VDDQFQMVLSLQMLRVGYCSSVDTDVRQPSVYMTVGRMPALLPAGLYAAALLL